jgi:hypothetical protein
MIEKKIMGERFYVLSSALGTWVCLCV